MFDVFVKLLQKIPAFITSNERAFSDFSKYLHPYSFAYFTAFISKWKKIVNLQSPIIRKEISH